MNLEGNCLTTAMGILPHVEVERALQLSLSLDIPFWPQLPKVSFFEDMYVQASEHFPGITLESIGPVSFGLKIQDGERRRMIYFDEVREIIFDFFSRKLQTQYDELRRIHPHPFIWVDEPGLEMLFMSFTGYTSEKASADYRLFLRNFPGPRGVHLCGNPDWPFLLDLDLDILSLDVLTNGYIFTRYRDEIKAFLERGAIICWRITPTLTEELAEEKLWSMISRIEELWSSLERSGIPRRQILEQAWFAPTRCCLINPDREATVERSFNLLKKVAAHFKKEL